MGLPTDGTKSFKIMTIDVHTIENGQLQTVHYLEDWGTAMNQLKSNNSKTSKNEKVIFNGLNSWLNNLLFKYSIK
ncbi:MAG: hypothetical protein ACRERV_07250 [Methylococcales bacterium]